MHTMTGRLTFLCLLLSIPVLMSAQDDATNLIDNGGFEEIEGKPKKAGNIEMAKGWRPATAAAPDLYTNTVPDAPISIPKNQHGNQAPLTGNNYAGIRVWSFNNKDPRQYLQAKFKTPLRKDQKYCIKYYVSLSDLSKYSSSELGAYVSKILVSKVDMKSLTYNAQVPHLKSRIYDDVNSWQGVCGVYDAVGGEHYLIIGNFTANEKTQTGRTPKPVGDDRPQQPHAYYYIDDVSVTPIKSASECTCAEIDKGESEVIYSRRGMNRPGASLAEKIDMQTFYFKRFQKVIPLSMEPWVEEMAAQMKEDPKVKVRLVGHIDETEKERIRMKSELARLGQERADAVKEALVDQGIDAARITTSSQNGDAPADTAGTEIGQSKNRRVEVELVK
jgi:OmpA-OmpF porin, OOP family